MESCETSTPGEDASNQLDAAAILLSLKTTPPSFPNHIPGSKKSHSDDKGPSTGYIPIYDWKQAIPSLSYAGNTYNINLQMYNSPVRLVPVPLNGQNANCLQEMSVAFIKFCQIHRDTIVLHDSTLTPDKVNEKLVQLWSHLPDEEKVIYSKVAKNEMLLMQGKDISTNSTSVKVESSTTEPSKSLSPDKCSPSLFRHPMFGSTPHSPHNAPAENCTGKSDAKNKATLACKSPMKNVPPSKPGKQRSLSLSEKPLHRIYIRRTVSQEEVSEDNKFAKPSESLSSNKKYFIRMRRHSMNDGILNSMEKINPYFTKNYNKSPLKSRNQYSKAKSSPKRNLSVSSLDSIDQHQMKSPPKRNRGFPSEADIFDFKAEPHGIHIKSEPCEDDIAAEDVRKTETFSYSLLKGASKTSSVNPCFSSRKMFVKKFNAIPSKCMNRMKQEYCKKGKQTEGVRVKQGNICRQQPADTTSNQSSETAPTSDNSRKLGSPNKQPDRPDSPTSSDVTMVTSSSMESLKSNSSSSSSENRKVELVNDSVLISHAIAELESAEENRLKGSRRSHVLGSLGISDVRYRHVCSFFREHGLNPSQEKITEFYTAHRDIFSCKSAALLTIREVRQKIIKLQLM